ncbi:MAG: DNA repair protein RecO [Oscillospiraceae bacterium]|nr:DNA repair protein RecO [Oscillospiraceae bacterium]
MLITVDGLVTARREFGDTSCYIDILTKEYGVIEVVAKGVKKLNSPNSAACALFAYATFCLNKKGLNYSLNSAKIKHSFHELANDIKALALAAYFAELIKFTATPEQSSEDILRLMLIGLYELCRGGDLLTVKAVFEVRLAKELGFAPREDTTYLNLPLEKIFKVPVNDEFINSAEGYLLEQLDVTTFKTLEYFNKL